MSRELSGLTVPEQKAVREYYQKLTEIFGKRLTSLKIFGSSARGERWEESDVDILVLINQLTWEEKRLAWDEATNINIKLDTLLSPLVMTPEEFQTLRERERRIAVDIDKEGIEL